LRLPILALLLFAALAIWVLAVRGGVLGGGATVTRTSTAIEYIGDIKSWHPKMAEYLEDNVSVYGIGDSIEFAGYRIRVLEATLTEYLEYNFTEDGKVIVNRVLPYIAEEPSDGEIRTVSKALYLLVEIEWKRVSEGTIPEASGKVKVGPGPLASLFAPWLLLFPVEVELEPSHLGVIASFDGNLVSFRDDESLELDPDKSLLIDLEANQSVGWSNRDILVFILPRDFRSLELVVTLGAKCPLGVEHPLCSPGLPIARIVIRE